MAWDHLLCGPQQCVGEKCGSFAYCAPEFDLRELIGYKLYQPFVVVGVRRDYYSVNTLAPCGGLLLSTTSESAEESDCGAHDVMVEIHARLHVNGDVSDKLAVWLPRDDVVKTFPARGPGDIECTRLASLGDGEERVDEDKLVGTHKP